MPDYVILHHQLPRGSDRPSHWDVMFQVKAVLLTWAVDEPPRPGLRTAARLLEDHRLEYLDYSGPVSGNRGEVIPWDRGTFQGSPSRVDGFSLQLQGRQFEGLVQLEPAEEKEGYWWVTFPEK
ncbi:MAG: DNA polymerase ligase N-terminal domain-containing protein [Planctomycetota bacterium]|nr:DNA polymerase ligase N-terminal domain-containing protein [Planctomycetota bacterium]